MPATEREKHPASQLKTVRVIPFTRNQAMKSEAFDRFVKAANSGANEGLP